MMALNHHNALYMYMNTSSPNVSQGTIHDDASEKVTLFVAELTLGMIDLVH